MNKYITKKGFNLIVIIIDLIIIYSSIYLSFILLKDSLDNYVGNYLAFVTLAPYIGIAYLIFSHIFELDKPKDFSIFGVSYTVALIVLCLFVFTMALSFLFREFAYPRRILLLSSFLQIVLLSGWHLFVNKKHLVRNITKRAIIIGSEKSKDLAYKYLTTDGITSELKYICEPNNPSLEKYIAACDIILLTEDVYEEQKQSIVEYAIRHDKEVLYEPQNLEILLFNTSLSQIEDSPLLRVRPLGISPEEAFVKRCLDIFLSLIASAIAIIPVILIYIALKSGGGSAFYRQERITKGGRPFRIFKFRTMVENAEQLSGPTLAQDSDPRITKTGRILRATRMDELPQLFNILNGDMSIVGPRPERPFFVDQYIEEMPEYKLRHSVKAGLTGYAQVHGKYNTTARDKLKYDLLYVNSYSLTLDIKLIMQTLNILLRKSSTEGVKEALNIEDKINELYRKE